MSVLATGATFLGRVWIVAILAFALWLLVTETVVAVRRRRDVRRARALGRGLGAHRSGGRGYARSRV